MTNKILFIFLILISAEKLFATVCSASDKGLLKWQGDGSTNAIMYCDGATWQSTDHGTAGAGGACAVGTGMVTYASSIFRYCGADGQWHSMKGSNIGTCSNAGNSYFNGLDWVFCDGTNIFSMNTSVSCAAVLTSGTSWPTKTSWSATNLVKVLGGGGGGGGSIGSIGGAGGGGGAFASKSGVSLTFPVTYAIGAAGAGGAANGGTGGTGGDTYFCSSALNCASIAGTSVLVGAKGGTGGVAETTAGVGGAIAGNIPASTGFAGGSGFVPVSGNKGGGGGGGAGPSGAGLTATTFTGAKGNNGSGGAAGAAGTEWGSSVGSGGGGSGGTNNAVGSAGGNYGAGGGGSGKSTTKAGGAGTTGLIYITWTSGSGNCL